MSKQKSQRTRFEYYQRVLNKMLTVNGHRFGGFNEVRDLLRQLYSQPDQPDTKG